LGDRNLDVVLLSRDKRGSLEGVWRLALRDPVNDAQLVVRSRVAMAPDAVLAPKGAEAAVLSLAVTDGEAAVPGKQVLARGSASEDGKPLLFGALANDRYSGVVRPDRDGSYRVRVVSQAQGGQAPGRRDLPPWLEKAFAVATADKVAQGDVGIAAE